MGRGGYSIGGNDAEYDVSDSEAKVVRDKVIHTVVKHAPSGRVYIPKRQGKMPNDEHRADDVDSDQQIADRAVLSTT